MTRAVTWARNQNSLKLHAWLAGSSSDRAICGAIVNPAVRTTTPAFVNEPHYCPDCQRIVTGGRNGR